MRVPRSALLDGQCSLDAAGTYRAARPGVHLMEMIGQRLFTGRVAVAQSALVFGRWLFGKTREYADNSVLVPRGARPPLSMPHLALYDEATRPAEYAEGTRRRERRLCAALRAGESRPGARRGDRRRQGARGRDGDPALLPAQAGDRSYALMKGSGSGVRLGDRQACRGRVVRADAEARARPRQGEGGAVDAVGDDEAAIVEELKGARTAEWLAKAEKVYALAELVMDRAMRAEVGAEIPKGVARPWAAKL